MKAAEDLTPSTDTPTDTDGNAGDAVEPDQSSASQPADSATSTPTSAPTPAHNSWALTSRDRTVVAGLAVICLVLCGIHWYRLQGGGMQEVGVERPPERVYDYRVQPNTATWVEWAQLPGIGDTLARRIVADRDQHGDFKSLDELTRIKGVGTKTLAKIRPWLDEPE